MADQNIQEQIIELNRKLDLVLEHVEQQKRNREEMEDLVTDVSIVAKDAFRNTVALLDKSQVDLDNCGIPMLLVRVLQNLDTFREMLELMESAKDFMKDVSPILHQVGLDAVNKMHELEQKGYFAYLNEMGLFIDKFIRTFTVEDLRNLGDNLDALTGIIRNLTQPELLEALNRASGVVATVKPDDKLDNRSLFGLLKQLNSPEVRRSLSYTLRILQALGKDTKV